MDLTGAVSEGPVRAASARTSSMCCATATATEREQAGEGEESREERGTSPVDAPRRTVMHGTDPVLAQVLAWFDTHGTLLGLM